MGNKRVFLGWSGDDNRDIVRKISNGLSQSGFFPIIGGEWKASFTVSEEIIQQMRGCDFAIVLIEKEVRRNDDGQVISMGFNPNVMMELGYLLHKVTDPNRIRRILVNLNPNELPSDLQGAWTVSVKKAPYDENDEEAREKVLGDVAGEVIKDFWEYIQGVTNNTDKLDYFDKWEENMLDIYKFSGDARISEKLIYGMQAAIYSGDFERLHTKLLNIKDKLSEKDRFKDYACVACAIAILDVFVVTRRLTVSPNDTQFNALCAALKHEYEKDIDDLDLKTWCKIFRNDKLELCYELYAMGLEDVDEKIEYYYDALDLCNNILDMINDHLGKDSESKDGKYALLYKAFTHRNIFQIHKALAELEPENAEHHLEMQKEYCAITLANRKELYDHYKGSGRENFISMDFISQEYLLSLSEEHHFEENRTQRREIMQVAKAIFNEMKDQKQVRDMIFEKVKEEFEKIKKSH